MALSIVGGTTKRYLKLADTDTAVIFTEKDGVEVNFAKKRTNTELHDFAIAVASLSEDREFVRMVIRKYKSRNPVGGGDDSPGPMVA